MIEFIIGLILGVCLCLIIGKHNKTDNNVCKYEVDAMEEIDREIARQELERWKND